MITDILGNKRYKINLHTHTTVSDGRKTPEEAARIYKEKGYDAIAITDHWKVGEERELEGLKIFWGCEYDFGVDTTEERVYHIVALWKVFYKYYHHCKMHKYLPYNYLHICLDY